MRDTKLRGPDRPPRRPTLMAIVARLTGWWRRRGSDGRAGVAVPVVAACLAWSPGAWSQACDVDGERAALVRARADLGRLGDAAPPLAAAAGRHPGCSRLAVVALVVAGWEEARRLAQVAGAPDRLGPVNGILRRLDEGRSSLPPASSLGQMAGYGEAAIRAAVAAAQDEREEMQVYLTHAAAVAERMAFAGEPETWPLHPDEAAAELWLEVDRFAEARDLYQRVVAGTASARAWLGLARTRDRLGDIVGACAAYRYALTMDVAEAPRAAAMESVGRLRCGDR